MSRSRVLSGLAVFGLAVGFAVGQPPATTTKSGDPPAKTETKPPGKVALEDAIATAMRNNPDIRVAEAEVQIAQAKLNQIRVQTAQKVAAAHAGLEVARRAAGFVAEQLRQMDGLKAAGAGGGISQAEYLQLQTTFARYQSDVSKFEADYNTALGIVPGQPAAGGTAGQKMAFAPDGHQLYVLTADGTIRLVQAPAPDKFDALWLSLILDAIAPPKPPAGSAADKLREALDKPVKLEDQKGVELERILVNLTRAAGLDLRVRVPPREDPAMWRDSVKLTVSGGEFPLGTWLQLVTDECARELAIAQAQAAGPAARPARYEIYVREYGLLVADPKNAPPGAATVQDFWRQLKAEKALGKTEPKK